MSTRYSWDWLHDAVERLRRSPNRRDTANPISAAIGRRRAARIGGGVLSATCLALAVFTVLAPESWSSESPLFIVTGAVGTLALLVVGALALCGWWLVTGSGAPLGWLCEWFPFGEDPYRSAVGVLVCGIILRSALREWARSASTDATRVYLLHAAFSVLILFGCGLAAVVGLREANAIAIPASPVALDSKPASGKPMIVVPAQQPGPHAEFQDIGPPGGERARTPSRAERGNASRSAADAALASARAASDRARDDSIYVSVTLGASDTRAALTLAPGFSDGADRFPVSSPRRLARLADVEVACSAGYHDPSSGASIGPFYKNDKWYRRDYNGRTAGRLVILGTSGLSLGDPHDFGRVGRADVAFWAGPTLVRAGRVAIDLRAEGYRDPGLSAPARRVALGGTRRGDFIIVGARQRTSLSHLAEKMIELGCETAVNLDGGSSAFLWTRANGESAELVSPERSLPYVLVFTRR